MSKSFTYIVLHVRDVGSSVLLYSPENMEEKFVFKSDAKVGEWYEINENAKTLQKCQPLCDTRFRSGKLEVSFFYI